MVGLTKQKVATMKEYQVVNDRIPQLRSSFPNYQARAIDHEERNKVAKPSLKTFLQNRIKKIEPHQTLVARINLIERDLQPKVDIGQTFESYNEIDFDNEDIKKEKEVAKGVVATMDLESARRYDSQLVNKMWGNVILNIGKVARYFQK
jgi:hypothetical protein